MNRIALYYNCQRNLKKWLGRDAMSVSADTGNIMSRLLFLIGVPEEAVESCAWQIARAWRFTISSALKIAVNTGSQEKIEDDKGYQEFMDGTWLSYTELKTAKRHRKADYVPKPSQTMLQSSSMLPSSPPPAISSTPNQATKSPTEVFNARQPTTVPIINSSPVDITNPFNVDLSPQNDVNNNDRSPTASEKVNNFLEGLEAAADGYENMSDPFTSTRQSGEQMDMDGAVDMDMDSECESGEGPREVKENSVSPLEKRARKKGWKIARSREGKRRRGNWPF